MKQHGEKKPIHSHMKGGSCCGSRWGSRCSALRELMIAGDGDILSVRVRELPVGGAPVNAKYARDIGADGYATDASGAVKLAQRFMQA